LVVLVADPAAVVVELVVVSQELLAADIMLVAM
jgi:hypothetical protein